MDMIPGVVREPPRPVLGPVLRVQRRLQMVSSRLERVGTRTWCAVGAAASTSFVLLFGHQGYHPDPQPAWNVVQTWNWYGRLSPPGAPLQIRSSAVVGVYPTAVQAWDWFGLLSTPRSAALAQVAQLLGWLSLVVLGLSWWGLLARARAGLLTARRAWSVAGVWWVPFVLGPPLTSLDIYSYAAQGVLARSGGDPYRGSPADLGVSAVLAAVDPRWRSAHSPYGPVALVLEGGAAVLGGSGATASVVWLRVLAVLATATATVLAVHLTARDRRARTIVLLAAHPVVLTSALSAGHLEAPMMALVLAAVAAERSSRSTTATVLSAAAGLVKAPAFLVTVFLVVRHVRSASGGQAQSHRGLARDLGALLLLGAAVTLTVPDAWGWIRAVVTTPFQNQVQWTPSTVLAKTADGVMGLLGVEDRYRLTVSTASLLGAVTGALVVLVVLRRHRATWEVSAGGALLTAALSGAVCYPWYLLWGLPLVLVASSARRACADAGLACVYTVLYLMPSASELTSSLAEVLRWATTGTGVTWLTGVLLGTVLVHHRVHQRDHHRVQQRVHQRVRRAPGPGSATGPGSGEAVAAGRPDPEHEAAPPGASGSRP